MTLKSELEEDLKDTLIWAKAEWESENHVITKISIEIHEFEIIPEDLKSLVIRELNK